jgi:DNA-binding transcriptional ArsR family regulator
VAYVQETLWIENLETLRAVVDPLRLRVLDALIDEPLNVKQIAQRLGEKPTRLYYHINALEDAGLVQVVDTRMKKNLVERYYLAVARDFRVDSRLLKTSRDKPRAVRSSAVNSVLQAAAKDVERALDHGLMTVADTDPAGSSKTVFARNQYTFRSSQIPHLIDRLQRFLAEMAQAEVQHGEEVYGLTIAFFPRSTDTGE